jgi:predicted nucleic acid-binding protein
VSPKESPHVRLEADIPPGIRMLLDTSVVLAYLAGTERISPLADQLLDGFVASGRNAAALSTITAGEILVRPFRAGAAAVATAEGFLRHFAEIALVGVDYAVVREAARIRAATGLPMPDAIVIASAGAISAGVLVTNDRSWRTVVGAVAPDVRLCVLDELLAGDG